MSQEGLLCYKTHSVHAEGMYGVDVPFLAYDARFVFLAATAPSAVAAPFASQGVQLLFFAVSASWLLVHLKCCAYVDCGANGTELSMAQL